jgi:hypothetical protein
MKEQYEYKEHRCGKCNALCDTNDTKMIHERFCEVPYPEATMKARRELR